jgi:UDP-N-acetylmuramate--alanine ligase
VLTVDNLKDHKKVHIIGIGGVSMSAIAETLHSWGHIVTGSDAKASDLTDRLIEHGIKVTIGNNPDDAGKADLIIYSAAIKEDDPDMVAGRNNGKLLVSRGEFVGVLTKMYKEAICVAGTHGKTTTTSMLSVCFMAVNLDPTIQVGAYLKNIDGNYLIGSKDYFILESCEYKENFLEFCPTCEIILNIDNDHLDYYKTFDNVVKAFEKFSQRLPEEGMLVTNADDKNCFNLQNITKAKFISYGIENEKADYLAKNISFDDNGFVEYDCYKKEEMYKHVKLSVGGNHNVLNSMACIAVCDYYGLDIDVCIKALQSFTGANRRLEYKGDVNGAKVFDDYGHHPTEIKATVKAIKNKKYNNSWVVFQPHTYTRTKEHLDSFADSLLDFDNIIVVDIYAAREKNEVGIYSTDLVNKILEKDSNKKVQYISSFDDVVDYLKENVKKDDLVLTLGAGTVTEISDMLVK